MANDPLDVLQRSDAELFEQIGKARELAFKDGEISKKHKLLIALAIDVAKHSEKGVRSLALQALEAGATKAEIMETLRVANHICGVGSMYVAANGLQGIL
jgi:alkylhydroperoxidase/carboxymuconolactone decarboxylase family protein YurZ